MSSARKSSPPSGQASRLSARQEPNPSLLPSPLPNDAFPTISAEDDAGQRLHEMFLSAARGVRKNTDLADVPSGEVADGQELSADASEGQPSSEKFRPFFTIIEDSDSGEQHHPHVHYVFSDDDSEPITQAVLNAVDSGSTHDQSWQDDLEQGQHPSEYEESRQRTSKNRSVIVDMSSDGRSIMNVRSLAPDWQVLDTRVTAAPSFNGDSNQETAGLMLRIKGVENDSQSESAKDPLTLLPRGQDETIENLKVATDNLAAQFQQEMDILRQMAFSETANTAGDDVT